MAKPSEKKTIEIPADYVTLVSGDGEVKVIHRSAAYVSGALRRMLNPRNGFAEAVSKRATLENINGMVLEKVCEYFYYNEKYKSVKDVPDFDIPAELCLELLLAADYLNS
ncbi:MAG: hypothetical protein M1816_002825 [Peltula sp. TS41687]|nr:MAG: hypothetical protein M1816_002825 [Peltula sp. TS41687]